MRKPRRQLSHSMVANQMIRPFTLAYTVILTRSVPQVCKGTYLYQAGKTVTGRMNDPYTTKSNKMGEFLVTPCVPTPDFYSYLYLHL